MAFKIAIMQPYFFPYAGYHRLLREADHFVIFDCVQFPRRGYVHRNQLPVSDNHTGAMKWLSLPLAKASRETRICDLRFAQNANEEWSERLAQHSCLTDLSRHDSELDAVLRSVDETKNVVDYLEQTIRLSCERLGISASLSRSSELNIPASVNGQERIITIARHFSADTYINAPGGKDLYDYEIMQSVGIELTFLSDYEGPNHSVLYEFVNK